MEFIRDFSNRFTRRIRSHSRCGIAATCASGSSNNDVSEPECSALQAEIVDILRLHPVQTAKHSLNPAALAGR